MNVDRSLIDEGIAAPNAIKQLRARENAAGALHQKFEQAELGRPEAHFAQAPRDAMGNTIKLDVA